MPLPSESNADEAQFPVHQFIARCPETATISVDYFATLIKTNDMMKSRVIHQVSLRSRSLKIKEYVNDGFRSESRDYQSQLNSY